MPNTSQSRLSARLGTVGRNCCRAYSKAECRVAEVNVGWHTVGLVGAICRDC